MYTMGRCAKQSSQRLAVCTEASLKVTKSCIHLHCSSCRMSELAAAMNFSGGQTTRCDAVPVIMNIRNNLNIH